MSLLSRIPPRLRPYATPGTAPRTLDPGAFRLVYNLWFVAFTLKVLGSTWDMAWHFRFLRDDLAPPHIINTVGTMLIIGLIAFHTWTGFGVTRAGLILIQTGMAIFLSAIPLDLINHAIFGLDITSWSPTHALLYLGTAVLLMGVLWSWLELAEPGQRRRFFTLLLGVFFLENILFPLGQQEYGTLAYDAYLRGHTTADAELVAAAGDNVVQFILPVPDWVYPLWLIASATLSLLAARYLIRGRWTATIIVGVYLLYRLIAYNLLIAIDFPPSIIPWMLLPGALAIDLLVRWNSQALAVALVVTGVFYAGAVLLDRSRLIPAFPLEVAPIAVAMLWVEYRALAWIERNMTRLSVLRLRA